MSAELCVCGEPIATCPHLGVFRSLEDKRAWYLDEAALHIELDALVDRAGAKQALEIAELAARKVSMVDAVGGEIKAALALVLAALAKVKALTALGG